jgi:sterol 3beta-glucosyltransferase
MKRIAVITVGTRGSVESVLALSIGLREAGYAVKLCAGPNLESYVRGHGFEYAPVDDGVMHLAPANAVLEGSGVATRLTRAVTTGAHFVRNFRAAVERMVETAWQGVQGADAIVYRPHGTGGHLLARRLGVPSFLVEPAPMVTPTGDFPSLLAPDLGLGRWYNRATYSLLGLVTWPLHRTLAASARRLGGNRSANGGGGEHPIVLNNFSPEVLPRPADWPSWAHATGWLFVPTPANWRPPAELVRFIEDGPPPLYLGFGSMARNAGDTTAKVLAAIRASGKRFVLSTGWGGLDPADVPEGVLVVESVPHEWLFPRMDAVVHHGGAGTIGNGLRAGKATVGCPFFGDQVFWSEVVYRNGLGPRPIPQHRLSVERLVEAIRIVTTDGGMRERARLLGEKLRREDGVARSVEIIREEIARHERARAGG